MFGIWIGGAKGCWATRTEYDDSWGFPLPYELAITFATEAEASRVAGIWNAVKPGIVYSVRSYP